MRLFKAFSILGCLVILVASCSPQPSTKDEKNEAQTGKGVFPPPDGSDQPNQ